MSEKSAPTGVQLLPFVDMIIAPNPHTKNLSFTNRTRPEAPDTPAFTFVQSIPLLEVTIVPFAPTATKIPFPNAIEVKAPAPAGRGYSAQRSIASADRAVTLPKCHTIAIKI